MVCLAIAMGYSGLIHIPVAALIIGKDDNGVIIGVTLFYALLSVTAVIVGDVLMSLVDPRISFSSKAR